MIFKKLPKELAEEGINLDLLNNINMDNNYSPVMLQVGDEPAKLLKCSTGYWVVLEDGSMLKGKLGYHVLSEKVCQIGRARYLLSFGKAEKKDKIDKLCKEWKDLCRKKLDEVRQKIAFEEKYFASEFVGLELTLRKAVDEHRGYSTPKTRDKLDRLIIEFNNAEAMYSAGDFVALLSYLGIMQFTNPMLSVKYDDDKGMAVLKNTFGAKALNDWDGDILNCYAAIEIEKQYPYLIF